MSAASSFIGDVRNTAHHSSGPLSNVNKNFRALADSLLNSQNKFDHQFQYMLAQGGSMTRVSLSARLSVLTDEANSLLIASSHLEHPTIADGLNLQLQTITNERTNAWLSLISEIETRLQLPSTTSVTITNPLAVLESTHREWGKLRYHLRNEPGHVSLFGTTTDTASYLRSDGVASLLHSSALRLVRTVSISAVQILPAPLPRAGQTLVVPATGTIHCGVVVTNGAYANQPVTIRITLTDSSGLKGIQTYLLHSTLSPMGSFAFVPKDFKVRASERATLTIVLINAPHLPGVATGRTYQVLTTSAG